MKGTLLTIYLALTASVALGGIVVFIHEFMQDGRDAPLVLSGLLSSLLLVALGLKTTEALAKAKEAKDKLTQDVQNKGMEEKQ